MDIPELLVPNELLAAVFRGEAGCLCFAMFVDAAFEIGRHADVERAVFMVGNDVDISRHTSRMLVIGSSGQARG